MKTQKTQYVEDDNHPVQTNAIGNGGVVAFGKDGSIIFYNLIIISTLLNEENSVMEIVDAIKYFF